MRVARGSEPGDLAVADVVDDQPEAAAVVAGDARAGDRVADRDGPARASRRGTRAFSSEASATRRACGRGSPSRASAAIRRCSSSWSGSAIRTISRRRPTSWSTASTRIDPSFGRSSTRSSLCCPTRRRGGHPDAQDIRGAADAQADVRCGPADHEEASRPGSPSGSRPAAGGTAGASSELRPELRHAQDRVVVSATTSTISSTIWLHRAYDFNL